MADVKPMVFDCYDLVGGWQRGRWSAHRDLFCLMWGARIWSRRSRMRCLCMQGVDIAIVNAGARNVEGLGDSTRGTKRYMGTAATEGDAGPPLGQIDVDPRGYFEGLAKVCAHEIKASAGKRQIGLSESN